MIRLQQIEAIGSHMSVDATYVFDSIESLSKDRCAQRFASTVRHRAVPARDRNQWRSFALAPATELSRSHQHEQSVLTAITDISHLWHRQVEEIDRFNFHLEGDGQPTIDC